jgi:hypothetical protein
MKYMAGVKELLAGVAPAAAVAYAEMPEAGRPPPSASRSPARGVADTPTVRRTSSPSPSAAGNEALAQLMQLMGLDASNPQVAQLLRAVVDTNTRGSSESGSGSNSGGRSPGNSGGSRITELPPDPYDACKHDAHVTWELTRVDDVVGGSSDGDDDSAHSLKRSEVDLQGEIGRGGMGVVYRGTYYGGAVAVKEIQGQSLSAADEAQFLKEIRLQR